MAKHNADTKLTARDMYRDGYPINEISGKLSLPESTLYLWCRKDEWKRAKPSDPLYRIKRRICILTDRENKSPRDLDELDRLVNAMNRIEKIRIKAAAADGKGAEGDTSDSGKRDKKRKRNDFSEVDEETAIQALLRDLFEYQKECWEYIEERIRNILKSRQIGMTWYFAREALTKAIVYGRNQIFLSASRAQSDVFREYIKAYAEEEFGVQLVGKDKIEIRTRNHGTVTLYFLSTNAQTAQSYHGDVYIDEYFWIAGFEKLSRVATAMASQKFYKKTFFSTPSAVSHEAYPFWSGDEFNERYRKRGKAIKEFPSRKALRNPRGVKCPDGQWRIIITLDDAEARGCNLFNKEDLLLEYSPEAFRQLFECHFIDDTESVFKISRLLGCQEYPEHDWTWLEDVKAKGRAVWIGYDPGKERDGCCIVVILPPGKTGDKFYVIEKITQLNTSWEYQASTIRTLTEQYNVEHIAIDRTGPGDGVAERVQRFFPAAECILYDAEKKTRMVNKAIAVIAADRLRWNAEWSDVPAGFMMILRYFSGDRVLYQTKRSKAARHAEAAWAIMHTLTKEDLLFDEDDEVISSFAA